MRAISPTKTYKCKECKAPFVKRTPWQTICGAGACTMAVINKSQAKREKAERKVTKEKLKKFETKLQLTEKVKNAFNAYIRARDYGQPCISCDRPIAWGTTNTTGGVCDAGHWLSVGARVNLRFNEDNVHAQCKHCNKDLSGNAANYRIRLVKKIGLERVEALECDHKLNHYTKDELREIEAIYKAKLKVFTL
jgi:Bacteriophage Lambda NinG protein